MPKLTRRDIPNPRVDGRVWQREIIAAARRLTRLQRQRRDAALRLKVLDAEIRNAKRDLKAITGAALDADPFEQSPPLRAFGESQG